jgi:hypothetical protein
MSASMSKTFMSLDFLTFLEEYHELAALWQVRTADYSNRAKQDEVWDLLVQTLFLFIFLPNTSLLQLASMNSFWILKCMSKVGSSLMRVG